MNAPKDFREMTSDTIGKDLLQALVSEIRLLPKPWEALPKAKQDDVIDRLRKRVDYNVKMAVHILAAEGRTVVAGALDQITIKDGVKAVVKFGTNAGNMQELFESAGQDVLVVVANPGAHTSGMDKVQGEADQRAMDLGHEYHDNDGGGMDDNNVIEGQAIAIEEMPLQADLDKAYQDGRKAAEEGQPESACPVMKGALCIQWVKGWKSWHEEHPADEAAE